MTAEAARSPAPRSPGACARCPAGATSSRPTGCWPRCARSAWPPPSSARTGSCPASPRPWPAVLDQHELQAVGGFTPLLLHVPDHDPVPEVDRLLDAYAASGAGVLVLSAVTGLDGYDARPGAGRRRLAASCWATWTAWPSWPRAAECGRCCTPTSAPWSRTAPRSSGSLTGSSVDLCLDTGHLLIGGTDPAELARQAPERIAHVHLKDVDARLARRVQDGG